jgi:hypothetical protein
VPSPEDTQTAESLQSNSRLFPFSGDLSWRLGSIATAARKRVAGWEGCALIRFLTKTSQFLLRSPAQPAGDHPIIARIASVGRLFQANSAAPPR